MLGVFQGENERGALRAAGRRGWEGADPIHEDPKQAGEGCAASLPLQQHHSQLNSLFLLGKACISPFFLLSVSGTTAFSGLRGFQKALRGSRGMGERTMESRNGFGWKGLKDHPIPAPAMAGTSSIIPGCSNPCPSRPWTFPWAKNGVCGRFLAQHIAAPHLSRHREHIVLLFACLVVVVGWGKDLGVPWDSAEHGRNCLRARKEPSSPQIPQTPGLPGAGTTPVGIVGCLLSSPAQRSSFPFLSCCFSRLGKEESAKPSQLWLSKGHGEANAPRPSLDGSHSIPSAPTHSSAFQNLL